MWVWIEAVAAAGIQGGEADPSPPEPIILRIDNNRPPDATSASLGDLRGVPGGEWRMGSPAAEAVEADEHPQVKTSVGPRVWMKTELTRGMWRKIGMTTTPWGVQSCADGAGKALISPEDGACPVTMVSWCDAVVAANRASVVDRLTPAYVLSDGFTEGMTDDACTALANDVVIRQDTNGYTLPTEAQWEWAARGGEGFRYAGSEDQTAVAWFGETTQNLRAAAGKAPNGWGLYDMSGNVWEWVVDSRAIPFIGGLEPFGKWGARGIRSGSWRYSASVARRYPWRPHKRDDAVGFRLTRLSFDP